MKQREINKSILEENRNLASQNKAKEMENKLLEKQVFKRAQEDNFQREMQDRMNYLREKQAI